MNKSIILLVAMSASLMLLSGCANQRWTRGDTGAVLGGAATAAVAHEVSEGSSNQTIYTAAGAIVGAILGRRLGRSMTNQDRQRFGRTLATNSAGQTNYWSNSSTNNTYRVTPTSGTYKTGNRTCRQFKMRATVNGQPDHVTGTACRQPDGSWVVQ